MTLVSPGAHEIVRTTSWGLLLAASFLGWGALAARALARRDEPADVGLRIGWGAGVVLFLGGILLATHSARGPVLVGVVVLGVVFAAADVVARRRAIASAARQALVDARTRPGTVAMAAVVVCAAALTVGASAYEAYGPGQSDDDTVAYMVFPNEMVSSGGSVQPFSFRHVHSLNGQSFLDALLLPALHSQEIFLLDKGVFLVAVLLAIVGLTEARWLTRAPVALLPELAIVLLPETRTNLTSLNTGILAFLTLHRSILRHSPGGSWRQAAAVGLSSAVVVVLRPSFVPALAVVLAVAYLAPLASAQSAQARRARLGDVILVAGVALAFLVPWMTAAYRSDATPLYPLWQGTMRHLEMGHGNFGLVVRRTCDAILADQGFLTPLLLVLAALCLGDANPRRPEWALVLGGFVAVGAIFVFEPRTMIENAQRYTLPIWIAMVLIVSARALAALDGSVARLDLRAVTAGVVAVVAFLVHLHGIREAIARQTETAVATLQRIARSPLVFEADLEAAAYARMQSSVPPGEGILAMTMHAHLFDFGRNPVRILDYPGLTAPAPGMPLGGTDDDYVRYLKAQGIRYLSVSKRRPDPYDLTLWGKRAAEKHDPFDMDRWMQDVWAPIFASVVGEMEHLSQVKRVVYRDPELVLVDLQAPAGS
jgi:hypothetical protein